MKKTLVIVIVAAMLLALLPATALAAGTTYVSNSTELASALASAGDGDAIYLYDGDYTLPATTLDKNLMIMGESEDGVVVKASASAAVWITIDATCNLKDLTLDGDDKDIVKAIFVKSDKNLTLENVTMKNIKAPGYAGMGVYNYYGSLTVKNVTMSEMGRIGIHTKSDINVDGFTYTGKGAGDWLDYGIEVGTYGKENPSDPAVRDVPYTVSISNVYISDCLGVASVDNSTSAGIYINTYWYAVDGGNTDLITANINHANISNCSTGVYVGYWETYGEYSNTTITNSNFFGNEYDLCVCGAPGTAVMTLINNYYDGDAPEAYVSDGLSITGIGNHAFSPIPRDTEVKANVDPTYTIIIPASVDFGTLVKDSGIASIPFSVTASGLLLEAGARVNVTVAGDFTMSDGGASLPYALYNNTVDGTELGNGDQFASFSADGVKNGRAQVNTSMIVNAGEFKDTMTFTITYVD